MGNLLTVRVINLSFHKIVTIRWTINNWASAVESTASYVHASDWEGTDKFKFRLDLGILEAGDRLQFCLKYDCEGVHWDNNGGANYVFQVWIKVPSCSDYILQSNHFFIIIQTPLLKSLVIDNSSQR